MTQTSRTTVRLPEGLLARARRKAVEEQTTLTALLEEGLTMVLERSRPVDVTRWPVPRIPSASGGLQPGVDTTKTADLLDGEFDELPLERRR